MHSLPLFIRLTGRPVILLGEGDGADAKRRIFERAGAHIVGEEADAALAVVAFEDTAAAEAAVARLKARGVLVNAVDRPALCDFTLPAIVDRDPVLIAIGTGGASAGVAKAIRQRLEVLMPASLGALATALSQARAQIKARWPAADARRKAIDAAVSADGMLDAGQDFRPENLTAWLTASDTQPPSGYRSFALASDDPDQLTLEQARLLGQADLVVYSPSIAPAILARARADAARLCAYTTPEHLPPGLTVHLTCAGDA
jgi:uroporphyrin-III C-methyltransferase / precorrin-2 dehydrogenase / sirohydrochlorin ferrochelatase